MLDIVVANAAIAKSAEIEDHPVEDFDRLFAVNVRSPFFLVQQLVAQLGAGANIVLLSSVAARGATSTLSTYVSTKGAINTLVRHFAVALGPKRIRVNAVAPGVIETDMSSFTKTDEGREAALGMQALKRVGQAEDVADVIAFIASDKARWIDGAIISVDGGSLL
jgi:3-oxoacyl-[acyl-carrier protein] reductase